MVKIKGGMTVTVPLQMVSDAYPDIEPGDVLEYTGTGYKLATTAVAEAGLHNFVIAIDYDESGDGYIGAIPIYDNVRISNFPAASFTKGEKVYVDGNTLADEPTTAGTYACIGVATSTTSMTTEINYGYAEVTVTQ